MRDTILCHGTPNVLYSVPLRHERHELLLLIITLMVYLSTETIVWVVDQRSV